MVANKGRDTKPELAIRRLLHAAGFRFRVDYRMPMDQRRRIDIAFTKRRVAVFVDGCFWHGCPEHYTAPKANSSFWREKVDRNRARDGETVALLENAGWLVLRFWAHEDPSRAVDAIAVAVTERATP